ncbi:hypothetical protein PUN28_000181 [Cardiocondyla obscurior]|uniref:Uncharacterized protein n=1 Tax=Cardiocondyla obscurior TaxID=286306 RepID=A0AAW2GY81_9HYME
MLSNDFRREKRFSYASGWRGLGARGQDPSYYSDRLSPHRKSRPMCSSCVVHRRPSNLIGGPRQFEFGYRDASSSIGKISHYTRQLVQLQLKI